MSVNKMLKTDVQIIFKRRFLVVITVQSPAVMNPFILEFHMSAFYLLNNRNFARFCTFFNFIKELCGIYNRNVVVKIVNDLP